MPDLHSPLALRCGLQLPDRIALAPLTNLQSHVDGTLGDEEYAWLIRRARGGFRWISTCAAFVSEQGRAWDGQLGIARDEHLSGLARLATGLREAGAVSVVQLHHAGMRAEVSPDPIGPAHTHTSRPATEADLARVVEDYVAAARRAQEAGFDGVEIHGANRYLFTQFLTPGDNPRTDRWGGSLENRARLLRDTLRAIRAEVSPELAVGVRISPVDTKTRRGLVLADSVRVGRWLAEDGADFVHLSLRDAAAPPPHEDRKTPVARAFREALPPDVPVFAAGRIWTREDAEDAMRSGVDVVVLGRAAIGNADWPRSIRDPHWEPARPPWEPDFLRAQAISDTFLGYLERFPGLVVGGRPAPTSGS